MTVANVYDVIVIGAGANGLIAGAALAKAGRRVLIVERAARLGGPARVHEFAPGFHTAPFALDTGWVPPAVARGVGLEAIESVQPDTSVTLCLEPGRTLALSRDAGLAADAIRQHSQRDAARYAAFVARLRAMSGFLETMYQSAAPSVDARALGDMLPLVGLGREYRALGREGMIELLRALPMPVQDLLDDEFESPALKAAIGAGAVRDIRQGPRSGGTTFVLLHYLTGAPPGSLRNRSWWRSGPGAFANAARAATQRHGAVIRTEAHVARILVRDDAVTGVVLDTAEEVFAPVVVSTADPAHTLLGMVDPVWFDPDFIHAARNIKFRGCTAVVHYAVDRLPDIEGLDGVVTLSASLDAIERAYDAAKYGTVADRPHVELTALSRRWPSLAPPGKHVIVARAQFTPYHLRGNARWDDERRHQLAETITATICERIPAFADSILHRAAMTPADIESQYGLAEGALTHGELTLDQVLFMRPIPGWAKYAMPIRGLYLGGAGAHPGPRVLGGAGWLASQQVVKDTRRS
jgi:phytoene dehydrogenase-like protein